MLIQNPSATDSLIFAHQASGSLSTDQVCNANAGSVALLPLGAARLTYVVNQWRFA